MLCVVASAVFTYYAVNYALFVLKVGRRSAYLEWPTFYWVLSMLVGFVLMTFYFVLQAIRQGRHVQRGS